MPPVRMRGDGRKARNPKKTLLRLLGYMKRYLPILALVLVCIFLSSYAQTAGSAALGKLVDDYILPMVATGSTDFGPLLLFLVKLGALLGLGLVCAFLYNYLMVGVSQGAQKQIRDEMFTKMQRLPLRYFDSNTAGNIMSRYTSDIDTLRQMVSQSIPQAASSIITLVVVFGRMLSTSLILTGITIITLMGVVGVTMVLAKKASKFFVGQQKSLGALNGYIEEMISGQKVVKVFTREETCKQEFDELNETLRQNAYSAGKFSNMMGPINNNLSYVQYAILAVIGGALVVASDGKILTLGSLMTFMILSPIFSPAFRASIPRESSKAAMVTVLSRSWSPTVCPTGTSRGSHRAVPDNVIKQTAKKAEIAIRLMFSPPFPAILICREERIVIAEKVEKSGRVWVPC